MKKTMTILILCLTTTVGVARAEEIDDGDFSNPSQDLGNESSLPNDAQMGQPTFIGSGCRNGTSGAILSPDKKTLTLLFDEFSVVAEDGEPGRRLSTECEIVLPFRVPAGMSVSIVRLDYRGYTYISENSASVTYRASYFLTGLRKNGKITKLARRKKKMVGPLDEEFFLSSRIRTHQPRSNCGEDFDFHIANEILVDRKNTRSEIEATVDSIDGAASTGVQYHLNWQKCDGKSKDKPKLNGKKSRST